MTDEFAKEDIVPAHPAHDDASRPQNGEAFDSAAYYDCLSRIENALDDMFGQTLDVGVQNILIEHPADEKIQTALRNELDVKIDQNLNCAGFDEVLLYGQMRQAADGRVAKWLIYNPSKFALCAVIALFSDIGSANATPDWFKNTSPDNQPPKDRLEQERLESLKATLTQAFAQSGLSEDKRETFLRETFDVIAKLQEAPAAQTMALPEQAPELYVGNRGGKKGGENIIDFLRRVWKPWIDAGVLTRPDLRRLDPKADAAVANWLRQKPLPEDIALPQRHDQTNQALTSVGIDPENPDMNVLRAAAALYQRLAYKKSHNP